ncbi:MAG TPA: cytochrome c [Bacteroidia bacterium]|nr:cytochrome c [Bacteroidia bacterium]
MLRKFATSSIIVFGLGTSLLAQDGAAIFKQNCGMCHKLGARLVGPDLSGVTQRRSKEWIHKFVKSSQSLVKSGDKDAVAIFNEFGQTVMPDQNVDDAQIDAILKYIEENSTSATAQEKPAEPEKPAAPEISDKNAFIKSAENGAKLFDGRVRFANGGPTCISCHNVNSYDVTGGGSLAKDLTDVYARIGDEGIKGVLSGLPFPAMKNAFEKHPLTDEEAADITNFLRKVSDESSQVNPYNYSGLLTWGGLIGIAILLTIFSMIWYNRKKKTVNDSIYSRQIKSY